MFGQIRQRLRRTAGTVNSPEFIADATKTKLPLLQKKGAEIQGTVDKILNMSPVAIAKARSVIFGK